MENIEIKVTKTNISITNGYVLNQGEYQVDKCKFTFSDEYAGLVKKAIFVNGNTSIDMVILNDECNIPYEILQNSNEFTLKVYGYQVQNEELVVRYSPTALKVFLREGSYVGSNEVITPSQFEQYEQALHDGLDDLSEAMETMETTVNAKLGEMNEALGEVETATTEANNLNLDVSKSGKVATVTLTKKDASTKVVTLSDGTSLMFQWDGTKLGIKTDEDEQYTYVDLQGVQGPIGPQGEAFQIKKTYSSVAEMNADFNNMQLGDYVMIASTVEVEDNAKLYTRGESQWIYISDFSGAQGIRGETGLTPNIQIGTVVSGSTPSVTRTGTNENPILNFTLVKGDKGDTGNTGETGATGNGIVSIEKTAIEGLVDTYTITYTNGTTTTFNVTNGEDGEVTQTQLDETNARVDLNSKLRNALPKVTGTGTELTLNDTAEAEMVLELSGNTEQRTTTGSNLLETKNISRTISGVTFTVNEDGSITIDGTATADAQFFINTGNNVSARTVPLKGNTSYIFKGKNDDNILVQAWYSKNNVSAYALNNFVTEEETFLGAYIKIQSGKTINNYTVYPQLVEGTELPEWEPYTGGISSPNPDYPQDIINVTRDNSVKVQNKNLFNPENATLNQTISATGTPQASVGSVLSDYMYVKSSTSYYLSGVRGSDYVRTYAFYDANKNFISFGGISGAENVKGSITTTANTKYIRIVSGVSYYSSSCQLEEGTISTSYVEHKEQTYPIALGDEKIGKINEKYKNYFEYDILSNKWYLNELVTSIVLNGTETQWQYNSSQKAFYILLSALSIGFPFDSSGYYPKKCSHFVYNALPGSDASLPDGLYENTSAAQRAMLVFHCAKATSLDEWKEWLSENNVQILLPKYTPTRTQITDTTLIQQLNDILNAYAYQDQTHITQENDGAPFNIDAEAVRDMTSIFDLITTNTTQGTEL